MSLQDIQNTKPRRNMKIERVGVVGVSYPIAVRDREKSTQPTVGVITMSVDLPRHFKGTHMSRFIEVLNEYSRQIDIKKLSEILEKIKRRFQASAAHLEVEFPYFINKPAPVTSAEGLMEYNCKITGTAEEKKDFIVEVKVPVTTLCPCSKAISRNGAHSQRCVVTVRVRYRKFFWIEDIISLVESCASADIYPVLKREDEKFVTEKAYDTPMFVEDIVREIAWKLRKEKNFFWFTVDAVSMESIHNYNVFAHIEVGDPHGGSA
ncbi:MAG TPA: GTP cyclohydrolase FolE2 [bacterium]